jgi:GTP cyclohydrolase IA
MDFNCACGGACACSNKNLLSTKIAQRLRENNVRFFCNDNISNHITEEERAALQDEVEQNMQKVLSSMVIDTDNDHNTKETAHRVAKMFMNEIFGGRYDEIPKVTAFPNANSYDELYVTGPITVRSTCAHHFQPIKGKCYIGVFPGKKVIGLSKFNRIVEWIASRPQIQEEMTTQIADAIEAATEAAGIAVLVQAEHGCMTNRGVKEHDSDMTTSVLRGTLRESIEQRQEFFSIVSRMK